MDFLKGNLLTGLLVGVGAILLAPVVVPVLREIIRPAAKALIKGGVVIYEQGRVAVAEAGEMAEDMVAEARSELEEAKAVAGEVQRPARRRRVARKAAA
jgi:hypothetical protein